MLCDKLTHPVIMMGLDLVRPTRRKNGINAEETILFTTITMLLPANIETT